MTVASVGISTDTIDYLFSSTLTNQANLDALAGTILGQGIDYYQKGNYKSAIMAFKRSAALSPFSDNTAKAYDYLGKAYLNMEDTDAAIKVYKEAVRIYPTRAEFQRALGDIYLTENQQEEALKAYGAAVRLDSTDAESRYSLGQCYLTAGQTDAAREQFVACVHLSPSSAAGYYGLGQTARKEGNYQEAVLQLTKAIRVNKDFEKAYVELAYTYADMGNFQKASEDADILSAKGASSATTVEAYITNAQQPKILAALSSDGFNTELGQATRVSSLSPGLIQADSSQLFSMSFAFSKDMDATSVQNKYNWSIRRASIQANGGVYNGGLKPPQTEAFIFPTPESVTYDTTTNKATIRFRISQNDQANATIDPAHIVFKFYGIDAYGKSMDKSADEYSSFSGVA